MLISKALSACTSTPGARDTVFSLGLSYLLVDLTTALTLHLIDWLASNWKHTQSTHTGAHIGTHTGTNTGGGTGGGTYVRTVWPDECQILPLLISAGTRLLNHAAASAGSTVGPGQSAAGSTVNSGQIPDKKQESTAVQDCWVRYLFASGAVSALCKGVRSLQLLHNSMSEEALPHLLMFSILDFLGALMVCVRVMPEEKSRAVLLVSDCTTHNATHNTTHNATHNTTHSVNQSASHGDGQCDSQANTLDDSSPIIATTVTTPPAAQLATTATTAATAAATTTAVITTTRTPTTPTTPPTLPPSQPTAAAAAAAGGGAMASTTPTTREGYCAPLIPFSRKEMVGMLRDLQVVPSMIHTLHRYVR
jgi:hypothetical protein